MPTVLELLTLTSDYLGKRGIESPRLNAELLLSHVLKCKRLNLYLSFDRPLSDNEVNEYRELIKRRKDREPLQYILGEVEFYGLPIRVNNSVLIPRPETEILVETLIKDNNNLLSVTILDIGTGSGCIAVALAKNISGSAVKGIDISEGALKVAQSNALLNGVDNVNFQKVDILNEMPDGIYDIVVSNPPYIPLEEYPELEPELKAYEPKMSLTDYGDGVLFYKSICQKCTSLLKPEGKVYFELGQGLDSKVNNIMLQHGFEDIKFVKDYQNINRVISGIKK